MNLQEKYFVVKVNNIYIQNINAEQISYVNIFVCYQSEW